MHAVRRGIPYSLMYTLFWWLLTGGVAYSWWFGVPIILIATAISLQIDNHDHTPKIKAIPAFLLHFGQKSLSAGRFLRQPRLSAERQRTKASCRSLLTLLAADAHRQPRLASCPRYRIVLSLFRPHDIRGLRPRHPR